MIVHGVDLSGHSKISVVEPICEERKDSCRQFMRKLKRRGVMRVGTFILDFLSRNKEVVVRSHMAEMLCETSWLNFLIAIRLFLRIS